MRWIYLAGWIVLCLGIGSLGARWTAPEIGGWYQTLRKPSFNPPNWVFGPVWTLLYVLMAVAMWRVDMAGSALGHTVAVALFLVQLALNLAWSWIFFHRHAIGAAAIELFVLWLAIAATMGVFARIDVIAAGLLVPYLGWVSFAFSLNAMLWRLNASKA
jgi:benzodiazapine receptor